MALIEVVSSRQIARRYKVPHSVVKEWENIYDFPNPCFETKPEWFWQGPKEYYKLSEVREWLHKYTARMLNHGN